MHAQHIDKARQASRLADAAFEEANSKFEDVSERLARLRDDLVREKDALKTLEADAVAARASGKPVKIDALDRARGAVRITSEAIEVVESQLKDAGETSKTCEEAAKSARKRVQTREAGFLLFEMAPVLDELVTRLHAVDRGGNAHVLGKLKAIVGAYSPLSNQTLQDALAHAGLDIAYGIGSDDRPVANRTIANLTIDPELARLLPRAASEEPATAPSLRRVV